MLVTYVRMPHHHQYVSAYAHVCTRQELGKNRARRCTTGKNEINKQERNPETKKRARRCTTECNFPGQNALPHADSRRETLRSRRHAEGKRQKKNKPVWESTSVKTTGTNFVTFSRTQKECNENNSGKKKQCIQQTEHVPSTVPRPALPYMTNLAAVHVQLRARNRETFFL
jgi:hypothetical protein